MLDKDPLYRPGIGNAVLTYNLMGQSDKAMELVQRARLFLTDDPYLARSEASIHNWMGHPADALPLAEFAFDRTPSDLNSYVSLAAALIGTNQFERVAEINAPFPHIRVYALLQLGRNEEATILAYQWANGGEDPEPLFEALIRNGKFDEMIAYLEQRWPDLNSLETSFPPQFGWGHPNMIFVAQAYRHNGNQPKFDLAMTLIQTALEQQRKAGADSNVFHGQQSQYWMLADDHEKALDSLQLYAHKGGWVSPRLSDAIPLLKSLEGTPRYEAIQTQMLERLNAERAKLDLDPLGQDQA